MHSHTEHQNTIFQQFGTEDAVLTWGIKQSFREYFERLPDHRYHLSHGARRDGQGHVLFDIIPKKCDRYRLCFTGTVQFEAHFGALSVKIADPTLEHNVSQDELVLTADVDERDGTPIRMTIATLFQDHEEPGRLTYQAELAEEGQYLFMGNYFHGEPLDPVKVTFTN